MRPESVRHVTGSLLAWSHRFGSSLRKSLRSFRRFLWQTPPAPVTQVLQPTLPSNLDELSDYRKPVQSVGSISRESLAQMERMLRSETFAHSLKLSLLLRYVVEKSLKKQEGELKESVIAVEVFGRKPSFDPRIDNVVRVNAGRLRSKLLEYYVLFGQTDSIVISLPRGRYVATFEKKKGSGNNDHGHGGANPEGSTPPAPLVSTARNFRR
jgi:hypothetical protein